MLDHLKRAHMVLLAAGIGQPYVTTDYPAAQRRSRSNAEAILLAKHGTDGIYDRDPLATPRPPSATTASRTPTCPPPISA